MMRKFLVLLLMLLLLSGVTAVAASAAEVTIEGVTVDNTLVQSTFGDRTVEVNKTIEAIEPTQSVDVKLTLKSSQPSPSPTPTPGSSSGAPAKTGDGSGMIGFVLALFVSAVAGLLLFKKKTRKTATAMLLVMCLLAVLAPAGALVFAQSAGYTVTELFTEEALAGFTFDRVVSGNVSAVETIENDNGRVIGLTWTTDAANAEQSVVYRLTLNEQISEAVIGKALNVSDAELVFTDAQGKTSALAYPVVSVKLNQAIENVVLTYDINNRFHFEYDGELYTTEDVTVAAGTHTVPDLHAVFPNYTGRGTCMFLEWNDKEDGTGAAYLPGETMSISADTTLYAMWKSCKPEINTVYAFTIQINGSGVYGIGQTGATIKVILPDGYAIAATVTSSGRWVATVPQDRWSSLLAGEFIEVIQTEHGKAPSDPVSTKIIP